MTDRLDAPSSRSRNRSTGRRRPADDPYAEDVAGDHEYDDEPDRWDDAPDDAAPDLTSLVPGRVRDAAAQVRSLWTAADSLAAPVIGIQLLVTTLEALRGSFLLDDLTGQVDAAGSGLGAHVIGTDGGLTPVAGLIQWLLVRLAPLEHAPVVGLAMLFRLALGLLAWRFLRRMFGPRAVAVLPLAVLLFTPALLPATLWYDRLVGAGLATLAVVWALEALLRWTTTRSRWALVQVPVATAFGLACSEQAAVIPVGLLAFSLVVFAGRGRRVAEPQEAPTSRAAARRSRTTVTRTPSSLRPALAAVALSWILAVPFLVVQAATGTGGSGDVVRMVGRIGGNALVMLAGGPWRWSSPGYASTPDLPALAVVAVVAVVAAAAVVRMIGGGRRSGGAAVPRAAVLALVWLITSAVCAAAFAPAGSDPALSPDRWSTLVPGLVLALALAFLPWVEGVRAVEAPDRAASAGAVTVISAPLMAAGLVVLVAAVGAGISTVGWVGRWWENPTGAWLAAMRSSVEQAEPYARVVATPLPARIAPADLMPTDAPLLELVRSDLRFHDGDGTARWVNPQGVLSPIFLQPLGGPARTATGGCVRIPAGNDRVARVRLAAPVAYRAGAQLQVGVLVAEATRVSVQAETADGRWVTPIRYTDDELSAGAHTLRFPMPRVGGGSSIVSVRVGTSGEKAGCLTDVQIWAPLS